MCAQSSPYPTLPCGGVVTSGLGPGLRCAACTCICLPPPLSTRTYTRVYPMLRPVSPNLQSLGMPELLGQCTENLAGAKSILSSPRPGTLPPRPAREGPGRQSASLTASLSPCCCNGASSASAGKPDFLSPRRIPWAQRVRAPSQAEQTSRGGGGHRNTPSPPSTGRLARRPPLLSLLPRDGDTDPEGGRTRAHLACCAGPGPELTWPSWARGGRGQTPGRAEADVKPTSPGSPPGRSLWVAGSCLGSPCQCQQELFLQSDAPSPDSQPISEGRGREQGQKAGPLLPKASSGLDPGLTFCPHPAQSLQFLQPPARSSSGSVRAIMRIPVTAELQQAARPHPS